MVNQQNQESGSNSRRSPDTTGNQSGDGTPVGWGHDVLAPDRRTFLQGVAVAPVLLGGQLMPSSLGRLLDPAVALQVGSSGESPGERRAQSFLDTLVEGFEETLDGTRHAYVAAGATVECPHGADTRSAVDISETWSGDEWSDPIEDSLVADVGPLYTPPGESPVHAGAGAEIRYEYDRDEGRWHLSELDPFSSENFPRESQNPPYPRHVFAHTSETERGTAKAAAVAQFGELGKTDERVTKTSTGTAEMGRKQQELNEALELGIFTGGVDVEAPPENAGSGDGDPAPDGLTPPDESGPPPTHPGLPPINLSEETIRRIHENFEADRRVGTGRTSQVPADGSDTQTIIIELTEPETDPDTTFEFEFEYQDTSYELEIQLPAEPQYFDIAPPGEPLPDPPGDLPPSLKEKLREHAGAFSEDLLTYQYAFTRPFDDVLTEYLSTPGTADYDRFQRLAAGESFALTGPVLLNSHSERFESADAAALSWDDIASGTTLVNDNIGSIPLGSLWAGSKTITFNPTPPGEPDTPIVIRTGGDGRIIPTRTLRGSPPDGPVDYEISMARADAHAVLAADEQGRVAGELWDAGRISVRPRGLINRINYFLATSALSIARMLGF